MMNDTLRNLLWDLIFIFSMYVIRYNEYYEIRLQDYDIDVYNMTLNGRIYQY
jgi:hypothetical protein